MSVSQMSVGQISVGQMSFGQMSIGQMSVFKMYIVQISDATMFLAKCLNNCLFLNAWWQNAVA
jgi:hypothetical protein